MITDKTQEGATSGRRELQATHYVQFLHACVQTDLIITSILALLYRPDRTDVKNKCGRLDSKMPPPFKEAARLIFLRRIQVDHEHSFLITARRPLRPLSPHPVWPIKLLIHQLHFGWRS